MDDSSSEMRPLTSHEYQLAKWMLEHGSKESPPFLEQLEAAQATLWRCPCGCASFNIAVKGKERPKAAGLHVLGDFVFGPKDQPSGIFIFEKEGVLAGVEVYGMAGDAPKSLPAPGELRPL